LAAAGLFRPFKYSLAQMEVIGGPDAGAVFFRMVSMTETATAGWPQAEICPRPMQVSGRTESRAYVLGKSG
jgi:hypothetical protein